MDTQTTIALWQLIFTVITAVVLIWYTIETYRLRKETQKQTEIQLRPFVILEVYTDNFCARNIGNGTAINVKVNQADELDQAGNTTSGNLVNFSPLLIANLPSGERYLLQPADYLQGQRQEGYKPSHLSERLKPYFSVIKAEEKRNPNFCAAITIEFQNVEMQSYVVKTAVVYGKVEISSFKMNSITPSQP